MTRHPGLPLPSIDATTLAAERLQLHHAARLLASTAHALIPHADDDSHSNLGLSGDALTLSTHWLDDSGRALVLSLRDLRLAWTLRGVERGSFELPGKTMAEGYAWLEASRPSGTRSITERAFPDFPAHPLGDGAIFVVGDPGRRAQLARYFGVARAALDDLVAGMRGASPRRIWPHHFDLGTVVDLAGPDRSVGLGLSPGDGSYGEPYFYVSPYPAQSAPLPEWDGPGHWHTDGFTSLVMTATEWIEAGAEPGPVADRFVREAFGAARTVALGRS
jgi:hypothetical protein